MDLRRLRESLAPLADRYPVYSASLRRAGFACCHVREDWIEKNCPPESQALHRRYLVEYAREALLSDSTSVILFNDAANCRSAWLNELKRERLAQFGPVDKMNSPATRHLVHLSPCLRQLSRISDSPDRAARNHESVLVEMFSERRSQEIELRHEEIAACKARLGSCPDEATLQANYAARAAEALTSLDARLVHTMQMYGPRSAVSFHLGGNREFVLLPSVSSSAPSGAPVTQGSLGMGFRLTTTDALKADKFQSEKYVVANLYALLPQEFIDYGRFSAPEELCLNILAWLAALNILLPDVLPALRQ